STKRVVAGIITMTALTTPFISEHAIAAIFLPIGIILYRISTKKIKDRNLGRLLMLSIAFGCNLGGPGAPTGGVRNVLMIGFMHEFFDIDVGFLQWMKYGIFYPLLMIPLLTYILLKIFKPQVKDMTPAIQQLREELEERGGMTKRQWAILGIFLFTLFLWVTDGNLIRILLGYRMGLGGIALLGALLYLIFGFASWDDYQRGIAWGVVLIYAGAISLGRGLISTGAGLWIAQITINLLSRVGMDSGFPLLFFAGIVTSILSNVMGSSGATVALLGPIILHLAEVSKTSLVGIGIGTSMASSFAFLFISGTPPNSIVYASGLVGARDFLKAGIPVFLVSLVVYVFIVGVLWRFIGLF
ncbi:MAG: SLC13 family permease, partial [Candidatus Methanofastidiosia archaeon]